MTKSLMIPIRPQHAVNILNGKKTLELRTWIPKDYMGWVYAYVTKGKRLSVVHDDENGKTYYYLNSNWGRSLNQDIPFRFWFDDYIKLDYEETYSDEFYWRNSIISGKELEKATCLSQYDIVDYGKNKPLYAWHIKKLEIFDEPKKLSDFYKRIDGLNENGSFILDNLKDGEYVTIPELKKKYLLSKPPQRSVWVYTKELENEII